MRAIPLTLLLCLAAGPVLAQSAKPPGEAPTPVSPVTVMPPTERPKLVSTWPENGQTVAPGVLVLKVVFDQQMTPRDFAYGLGGAGDTAGDKLNCLKTPRLLNDSKTFVLLCTTLPGKTYAVALNPDAPGGPAFSNLAENRAAPSALTFTTGTGYPVTNLRDAMKAAGLSGLDMPVEEAPEVPRTAP